MVFTQEQLGLQQMVHEFAEKEIRPVAKEYDKTGEFPMELYKKTVEMGIHCLDMPEEYGGPGISHVTASLLREEMSWGDAGFSLSVGANSLGMKPLMIAGTKEQCQHFADIVVPGGFSAFALTEPDAGSDAGSVKTTAVRVGDEYILNGRKCFITNGGLADIYTVVASTDKSKGTRGLTMFSVDRNTPGISVGKHEDKLGIRLSNTADVIFEDVRIPAANRIGDEGKGFKIAMMTLNEGRASTAASACGIARAAFEYAIRYSQERITFGQPICKNQAVAFMLADMGTRLEAARLMGLKAAELQDLRSPELGMYGAMAKCFATDVLQEIVSNAVQIFGGYGYMRDYPVEKLYRDSKIYQIFEGTNQIQRMVISGQLLKKYAL
ncbi:MAG: acyl-CoA dehydrogenase [Lachnospiraceae bacterium]|nr:acyl-CoA dehydrogenase [Lachnospiraceae bacterium]